MSYDANLSLWARQQRISRRLRVGILSDGGETESWLAFAIRSLPSQVEIEVSEHFLLPPAPNSADSKSPWLFRKLGEWSCAGNVAVALSSVSERRLSEGAGKELSPSDRSVIIAAGLDILLCTSTVPLSGDCDGLARLGVWSFLFGEPDLRGFRPPFWREVYQDRPVTRVSLLVHEKRFERGHVIEDFIAPTVPSLRFSQNQVEPLKCASAVLGRSLLRAAASEEKLSGGEEIVLSAVTPRWPSTSETLAFVARKLGRSAALHWQARGKEIRWVVGIRAASPPLDFHNIERGGPFLEVPAPPGHYYADPFIVDHNGRHWLFVEDWVDSNHRGRLACLEVREGGDFGEPVVILDTAYHLSYPHVFLEGGEYFMIPESAGNGKVQLYRASKFPFEWKLEANLMENMELVDTTAFHYEDHWYFFTTTVQGLQEGYLFTSNRIDGAWQYHPANPVCTDTRRLRGAGAIFEQQGVLIRPAQDCSLGYGYALTFNEILRLSLTEYEERASARLLPTWAPGLTGTHTYNLNSRYEVLDGQKLVGE